MLFLAITLGAVAMLPTSATSWSAASRYQLSVMGISPSPKANEATAGHSAQFAGQLLINASGRLREQVAPKITDESLKTAPAQADSKVFPECLFAFASASFFVALLFLRRGTVYIAEGRQLRERATRSGAPNAVTITRRDIRFHVFACVVASTLGSANVLTLRRVRSPVPVPWLLLGRMASTMVIAVALCHLSGASLLHTIVAAVFAGGTWTALVAANMAPTLIQYWGFMVLAVALGSGASNSIWIAAEASQCKLVRDRVAILLDVAAFTSLCYFTLWITIGYLSEMASGWCFGCVDMLFVVGFGHILLKIPSHGVLDAALQLQAGGDDQLS